MQKQQLPYFKFVRGIAILCIIGMHTFPGCEFGSIMDDLRIMTRQLLNCAVPIFLTLDAYIVSKTTLTDKSDYFRFLKLQLPQLYSCGLFWSIPYLILALLKNENPLKSFILFLICGLSVYYFIALLIQNYILLPLLKNPSKKILYLSCLITVISILIVTYVMQIKGINALLIMYAGPFPVWLAFFVLGLYLANSDRMYKLHFIVLFVLIGAVLSYFEYQFLFSFHGQGAGIKLSAYIYSFALLLFLFSKRIENVFNPKFFINKFIVYLGEIAFGIYLTHMFFVTIINHFHINAHLNWPVYFLIILIVSTGFVTAIKKLLSENALKYIGF